MWPQTPGSLCIWPSAVCLWGEGRCGRCDPLSAAQGKGSGAVRIMSFHLPSTFNTIHPLFLRDKLTEMMVDSFLVSWTTDYLMGRPQDFRLRDCSSETAVCGTDTPRGIALSWFVHPVHHRFQVQLRVMPHAEGLWRPRRRWWTLWRTRPPLQLVSIEGVDVEVVRSYEHQELQLDDKLNWSANTNSLYRKSQNQLCFLSRLWSCFLVLAV